MRIGELAERTGVSIRSLRYYETKGLMAAPRNSGGQRKYPEAAVDRVRRIQEMFAAGLHSETIAELLPCIHDVDGTPTALATPFLVGKLTEERARIDKAMHDLRRTSEALDGVIRAAGGEALQSVQSGTAAGRRTAAVVTPPTPATGTAEPAGDGNRAGA